MIVIKIYMGGGEYKSSGLSYCKSSNQHKLGNFNKISLNSCYCMLLAFTGLTCIN